MSLIVIKMSVHNTNIVMNGINCNIKISVHNTNIVMNGIDCN